MSQAIEVKQLCNFCKSVLEEDEKNNSVKLNEKTVNSVIQSIFILELYDQADEEKAGNLILNRMPSQEDSDAICDIIDNIKETNDEWNYDDMADAVRQYLVNVGYQIIEFNADTWLV